MSKLEELKKLKQEIEINGLDNFPLDNPSIIVSNHNCLMDVFYQPLASKEEIVSLISPRLIYKPIKERQEVIEKYLFSMPIEAHGGKKYSSMCLNMAVELLKENISVGIFPEGAYIDDKSTVYRGRTGASRILFDAFSFGINANLVPVSINVINDNPDLDNFDFNDKKVVITIMPPINYENAYDMYTSSETYKNEALHLVIDEALRSIAYSLDRKYTNEYIELFKKGNVIFSNGETVTNDLNDNIEYINRYKQELEDRKKVLIKQIKCK